MQIPSTILESKTLRLPWLQPQGLRKRARKCLPYQDIYSEKTQAHSATNYFTLDIPDQQRPVLLIASWPQDEHVQPLLGRPATKA